ncbi:type IV secretion system DNA-binding domain-containing protein [Yinghuangia sp. ASG 101]|uniref:type IV secretion system DNA-binding domain-containing protein n=1 Tax=Yinghuangia sp. ASG 101 TaxID=2896848 RepID=UPI001E411311|nr:type IV secretion system DNA-binding domain-containing protein [Yinghuangia sp. ASG 101]UGQ13603.1 type IV secretion system DNA-binding domain-containing protein [Yinghuangia sp. ASG 101]
MLPNPTEHLSGIDSVAAESGGPLGRFLTDPTSWWTALGHTLARTLAAWPWWAPPLVAALTLAAVVRARVLAGRARRFADGARCVAVLAPPTVDPAGGVMLWAHLAGLARPWWRRLLEGQPHLAFEYAFAARGLAVRIWVPTGVPVALVRRAVEAAWPGAHTRTGPADAVCPPGHTVEAGGLRLARPEVLPLRFDHPADPLRPLLQAATGLDADETATVQILARPAAGARLRRARRASRRVKAGQSPHRLRAILDLLRHAPSRAAATKLDPAHAAELRQLVAKSAGPQWEVALRYAATRPAPAQAEDTDGDPGAVALAKSARPAGTGGPLEALLRTRVHALATAMTVFADRNWLARTRLRRPAPVLDERRFPGRGFLLSVPELAALAHLPLDPDAPGVARAGARAVMPPSSIPAPGSGDGVKPLGRADAGHPRPVGVHTADARHHLHVVGATGCGKSTLLAHMILADAEAGRGAVVIDPKGDLVTELLARLPESAADRLVVLDPDDPHAPPRMNVLDSGGTSVDMVVDNITGIFRRIFPAFWGPRTDDVMRAACLTLLRTPPVGTPATLADVPRLLDDEVYRRRTVARLDPNEKVLRGFWAWYEQLSDPARAAVTGPLMNKLRAFLLRSFVHQTVAAGDSTFDLASALDGGIVLARLPKGVLGEETVRLLGSFVVAKTWQAAAARARTREHQRRDAVLVVDECHNFLTLAYPLEDMLAEARGYRLGLVLAHQHLAQLTPDLREGISANARNKVYFTASPEDARALQQHTKPTLTEHDLAHLGGYQAAARLLVDGAETTAFTLTTRPLPPAIPGRTRALRDAAHRHAGPHTHPSGTPPHPGGHP